MDTSNTGDNRPKNKGQFVKGDARINRKGRPKTFDELRDTTQSILHELALDSHGNPVIINGHKVTKLEMLIRGWIQDKQKQERLIEIGFGKVPQPVEISGKDGQPVIIKVGIDPDKI